jgi:hypothetical protein
VGYVLGDDEDAVVGAEGLSDLLDLTGTDVGEGSQDDLLVGTEQLVQLLNCLLLFLSCLSTTSH